MSAAPNLLAVRLARFQAGRRLVREVYLPMPRNGKNLRLVWKGDEIRPELLERLAADAVEVLYVAYGEDDNRDPERIPLFEREVEAVVPRESVSHADLEAVVSADKSSLGNDRVGAAGNTDTQGESAAAGAENEGSSKVGAADQEALAETRVGGADGEDSVRVKGEGEQGADPSFVAVGPADQELTATASVGADLAEQRFSAAVPGEETEGKAGVLTTHEGSATVGGRDAEDEGTLRVEAAREALRRERDEIAEDSRRAFTVAAISTELEQLAERIKGAPDHMLAGLRDEAKGLAVAMQEVIATGEVPPEVAERFDVSADVEKLRKDLGEGSAPPAEVLDAVHKKAEAVAQAGIDAIRDIEKEAGRDRDLARADGIREMPLIASRFAAYLGYSLGYVDLAFLSELSAATAMHFEGTDLHPLAGKELPRLAGLTVREGAGSGNEVVVDAVGIIQFLEAYFRNPACDRTYPDLVPRTFAATVEQLHSTDAAPDAVRLARWRQFVEKGPSFNAHSVCSKAVSHALKEARRYRGHEEAKPFR